MSASIITLTTDFGLSDGFIGVMHGVIAGIAPKARIIDLSHAVPAQDVRHAAFLLQSHARYFPEGTIHLAVVDPGVGTERKIILAEHQGQCYMAPDNGLLTFLLREKDAHFYTAANQKYWLPEQSNTFHGRDIFAPLAAHIASGVAIEDAFKQIASSSLVKLDEPGVQKIANEIIGSVIHVDHFGNLITNIEAVDIPRDRKIVVQLGEIIIDGLARSYSEKEPGDILAIINSFNRLEISVNHGRAEALIPELATKHINVKCSFE